MALSWAFIFTRVDTQEWDYWVLGVVTEPVFPSGCPFCGAISFLPS